MILNCKRKGAGITVIPVGKKQKVLLPGHNEIDDEDWKEIEKSKSVQRHIKEGNFEVVMAKVVEKKGEGKDAKEEVVTKPANTLKDLDSEQAEEVIKETYDVDILKKWKAAEGKRDDVRALIQNQIDLIMKENPEK